MGPRGRVLRYEHVVPARGARHIRATKVDRPLEGAGEEDIAAGAAPRAGGIARAARAVVAAAAAGVVDGDGIAEVAARAAEPLGPDIAAVRGGVLRDEDIIEPGARETASTEIDGVAEESGDDDVVARVDGDAITEVVPRAAVPLGPQVAAGRCVPRDENIEAPRARQPPA